jgi:hypothetical protein
MCGISRGNWWCSVPGIGASAGVPRDVMPPMGINAG